MALKKSLDKIAYNLRYALQIQVRMMSGQVGVLPQFIIIGTQKGGTTSLYDNLVRHPQILSALKKEIHYFDHHFSDVMNPKAYHSLSWYRAHFPSQTELEQQNAITGEATPFYLLDSRIPPVLAQIMPDVKLIVLLRNPIHRSYSHYQMSRRNALPEAAAEDVIEQEMQYLQSKSIPQILEEDIYDIQRKEKASFLVRSLYAAQLKPWLAHFPRKQFLILKSEDYFSKPEQILQSVTEFLNVTEWKYGYQKTEMESFRYPPITDAMREQLELFFKPYNQELYSLLQHDFGWS